jgi:hypothetical protein
MCEMLANRFHLFLFFPVLSCVPFCVLCCVLEVARQYVTIFHLLKLGLISLDSFLFFVLIGGYNFLKQLTIRDLSYLATIS